MTAVDLVADHIVDPADPVDSVVDLTADSPVALEVDLVLDPDLVLRSVEAFLLFTISVLCAVLCTVKCLDDLCLGCLDSSSGK